jgi:indole-3-acetate monooxygenase
LLKSIDGLAPLVQAEREAMEAARELPSVLVEAMVDAGLFRLLAPNALGGSELDPVSFSRVMMALSVLDGSVGWNAMIGSGISWLAGRAPEPTARSFFGDRRAVVAGHFEPRGRAVLWNDGYRVSGRWSFGSGCRQATAMIAACIVHEDGKPRLGADGQAETRVIFLPADRCTIHDTWHVSGLRGTGSHDYTIDDQYVPFEHTFDLTAESDPTVRHATRAESLYAMPLVPLYASMTAAVALGIAKAAIGAFMELSRTKRSFGSPQALSENSNTHRELGRAQMLVHTAESSLFHDLDALWNTVKGGQTPTLAQHADVKMSSVNAALSSGAAVDLVCTLAGTSAIFEAQKIERCFRDVHVAMQHVQVAPKGLETVGRVIFGMEPNAPI